MSIELTKLLKSKAINEWNLFWLISGPISIVMIIGMLRTELSSGEAVSSMIQLSVRCAVPWLYLAFAVSSIQLLFPGPFSFWLMRNRKFIGLCFAAAMGWQLFFILWLVTVYSDYYINEVYVLRDAIEGVAGYLFLIAMTVTSFRFARKHLKPKTWKLLHKSGIYFLWAYAFSVYWWALFYYENPVWIDYVYYWTGLLACGLRIAAWWKKRSKAAETNEPQKSRQPAFAFLGYAVIGIGLIVASSGSYWYPPVSELVTGYGFTEIPELYMPYWPFEPFFATFVIALGAFLAMKAGTLQTK